MRTIFLPAVVLGVIIEGLCRIINAKIVVGADGIHSQIRTFASLGGRTRYSGSSSYRAIAKGANLLSPELNHDASEIWGRGCRYGLFEDQR